MTHRFRWLAEDRPHSAVLLSYYNSGSTWVRLLLQASGYAPKKTQNKFEENDYRTIHFRETKKLLYLRRNPYDIYASAITRYFKLSKRYEKRKSKVASTPETAIQHHLSALEMAMWFPNLILLDYEKLCSPSGFETFREFFPAITKEIWDKYSYDTMIKDPYEYDRQFGQGFGFGKYQKLDGIGVGDGKKLLRPLQIERLEKAIDKYDYWNKMKKLDEMLL